MGFHGRGGGRWHRRRDVEDDYDRKSSDKEMAIRLVKYTFRFRRQALLLGVTVIIATILNLLPPILWAQAYNEYIPNSDFQGLNLVAAAFIGVSLLSFGTSFVRTYLLSWMGGRLEYELRLEMFHHLQKLSMGYYAKREVGSIVSRVTNDIDKIIELVSSGIISAIVDTITLVGTVGFMLYLDTQLALISFSIVPVIAIFAYVWGKRVRKVYKETRQTIASVSAKIEESVSGMKEIQSFSREKETRREFEQVNISNMQANVQASRTMSAFMPLVNVFSTVGRFLIYWYGGNSVINGTMQIGDLLAFDIYITRFFWPIQSLSNFWNSVQSAFAAAERVFGILDFPLEIVQKPDAIQTPPLEGKIVYEDMNFYYEKGTPVLDNVNLTIEKNETVALVGPTGAGKTTMVNLLYRFYDPVDGKVTVDGLDLRDLDLKSYRHQMAIVLQDPFLFAGTVKENIKYGNLNASDEKVVEVAKAVGAHNFIMKLPDGYETEVRERGSRLSQGQRQLISLARALIADPKILIMDEATSSIDAYTEIIIKQAMEKVLQDRTSIVIAHRLSTVRNSDKIVVIDDHKIQEMGTHEELLERGGLYKTLYDMQFKYEPDDEEETQPEQPALRTRGRRGRPGQTPGVQPRPVQRGINGGDSTRDDKKIS
jgi:ATP-binding cassette subfamily B protein